MLRLQIHTFALPKQGYQPDEYEDAWAHDATATRLALADGASDSFESRLWASALVQAFIDTPPAPQPEALLAWLEAPLHVWRQGIRWQHLPWYAEEKARRGVFATLLGLTFAWPETPAAEAEASWQAVALGDACLFQIRHETVIARFPVTQAADFGTTPALLSTRRDYTERSLAALATCTGICLDNDLFVLATDALAAWFLAQIEAGAQPWKYLLTLTDATFADGMAALRQDGAMRNDDVTLVLGRVQKSRAQARPTGDEEHVG